jgi:hypothetical protein
MRSCRIGTSRLGPSGRGVRSAPLISHSRTTALPSRSPTFAKRPRSDGHGREYEGAPRDGDKFFAIYFFDRAGLIPTGIVRDLLLSPLAAFRAAVIAGRLLLRIHGRLRNAWGAPRNPSPPSVWIPALASLGRIDVACSPLNPRSSLLQTITGTASALARLSCGNTHKEVACVNCLLAWRLSQRLLL